MQLKEAMKQVEALFVGWPPGEDSPLLLVIDNRQLGFCKKTAKRAGALEIGDYNHTDLANGPTCREWNVIESILRKQIEGGNL